jgi:hypothetical protein
MVTTGDHAGRHDSCSSVPIDPFRIQHSAFSISSRFPMTKPRLIHDVSLRILAGVRDRLGDAWDALDGADRERIILCAADAAELQLKALSLPQGSEEQLKLLREKAQIHAQLANLTAAGAVRVAAVFWDAVRGVVNGAVAIAFAAL